VHDAYTTCNNELIIFAERQVFDDPIVGLVLFEDDPLLRREEMVSIIYV